MANTLLTETHCARLLVAVLANQYGFNPNRAMCSAMTDYKRRKMRIQADVSNDEPGQIRRFSAELTFEDLQKTTWQVSDILATQVQSQVFTTWSNGL